MMAGVLRLCMLLCIFTATVAATDPSSSTAPIVDEQPHTTSASPLPLTPTPTQLTRVTKERPLRFVLEEIASNHSHIRAALLRRGWQELVTARPSLAPEPTTTADDTAGENSSAGAAHANVWIRQPRNYDLKWTWTWDRVLATRKLPPQYANHFSNGDVLGTKIGLLNSLRSQAKTPLRQGVLPHNEYVPRSYLAVREGEREPQVFETEADQQAEIDAMLADIKVHASSAVKSVDTMGVASLHEMNSAADGEASIVQANVTDVIDKQSSIDAGHNIWIVKPSRSARGTGIRLFNASADIMTYVQEAAETADVSYIVQKYIERPLLINGRKFDVRLFALVPSLSPLVIFANLDFYLRFTTVPFSMDNLKDRYVHLCNHQVQKESPEFSEEEVTQWPASKFKDYIVAEHGEDVWNEKIIKSLHAVVLSSLLSWPDRRLAHRDHSFELYGFDIMFDTELNPWLLEINSSPGLHLLTDVVQVHHTQFVEDMFKVVLDNRRCWQQVEASYSVAGSGTLQLPQGCEVDAFGLLKPLFIEAPTLATPVSYTKKAPAAEPGPSLGIRVKKQRPHTQRFINPQRQEEHAT